MIKSDCFLNENKYNQTEDYPDVKESLVFIINTKLQIINILVGKMQNIMLIFLH